MKYITNYITEHAGYVELASRCKLNLDLWKHHYITELTGYEELALFAF